MRAARKPALPDGDAQIKLIRRMMYDVKIPEKTHFVADAVKPIIDEIIGEQKQNPSPPSVHRHVKRREILVNQFVEKYLNKRENRAEKNAAETEREISPKRA